MTQHKCNGWSNLETWTVNTWLNSDLGGLTYYLELAARSDSWTLAGMIRRDYMTAISEPTQAAKRHIDVSKVNWQELAMSLINDAALAAAQEPAAS